MNGIGEYTGVTQKHVVTADGPGVALPFESPDETTLNRQIAKAKAPDDPNAYLLGAVADKLDHLCNVMLAVNHTQHADLMQAGENLRRIDMNIEQLDKTIKEISNVIEHHTGHAAASRRPVKRRRKHVRR